MATPFIRNEAPWTQTRLSSLIKIFGSYGGYQINVAGDGANTLTSLPPMSLIGAVTKVMFGSTRGAVERRELNSDTLGAILEMVPGLVSFDVSFESVWLYQASFLEACGFGGTNLINQTRPMLYSLLLPTPNQNIIPTKTILLLDCWLKTNPAQFQVENKDDLRIVQRIDIACGGLVEVQGSTPS